MQGSAQRETWRTTGGTPWPQPPSSQLGANPTRAPRCGSLLLCETPLLPLGAGSARYLIPTALWAGTVGWSTTTCCPAALLSLQRGCFPPPTPPQTPFVPRSLSSNYPYLSFQGYEQHCRPDFSLSSRADCIHIDGISAVLPLLHRLRGSLGSRQRCWLALRVPASFSLSWRLLHHSSLILELRSHRELSGVSCGKGERITA